MVIKNIAKNSMQSLYNILYQNTTYYTIARVLLKLRTYLLLLGSQLNVSFPFTP